MRRMICMLLACIMLIGVMPETVQAKVTHDEMRGVWISSVYNLDYPKDSSKNNPEAQKREFMNILDKLQAVGINTVFVQVRPKADALYKSAINPWSEFLTGTQGKDPGYDPMAFMIEETHKRGMAFHAWLNPYRVTTSGTDVNALAANHPARLHPEWTIAHENKLYYNPALPEVQQHVVDTVVEIINNYDVDGIHFDDYFYPSYYPLPEGEGKDGPTANSRREHINSMVKKVSQAIQRTDDEVAFGISPIGIWKNKASDAQGSDTSGGEGYYSVFADAKAWVENEWIDYIVPQIYWGIGHEKANYATLVKWWSNLVKGTDVKLYIGQGIYKDEIAKDIANQLLLNETYPQIEGNVYFSLKDIMNNRKGIADTLTTIYKNTEGDIELPVEPDVPVEPDIPVEPEQPVEPDVPQLYKMGRVEADKLNVRSGAGTNYDSIAKLDLGATVEVLDKTNGWYKVRLKDGRIGYTSANFITISDDIRLVINNKQVMPDVAPVLEKDTTLVPLRIISENLGVEVGWDPIKKEVTLKKGSDIIKLPIGSTTVYVNGEMTTISIAPKLIQDTTMVPIRFIAETLGAEVDWDNEERVVIVNQK